MTDQLPSGFVSINQAQSMAQSSQQPSQGTPPGFVPIDQAQSFLTPQEAQNPNPAQQNQEQAPMPHLAPIPGTPFNTIPLEDFRKMSAKQQDRVLANIQHVNDRLDSMRKETHADVINAQNMDKLIQPLDAQVKQAISSQDTQISQASSSKPNIPAGANPVTDPTILAQLNGTQQPTTQPSTQPPSDPIDTVKGYAGAAGTGAVQGAADAAASYGDMALNLLHLANGVPAAKIASVISSIPGLQLASNLLHDDGKPNVLTQGLDAVQNKIDQFQSSVDNSQMVRDAQQNYPKTYAAAAGTANVGVGMLGASPLSSAVEDALPPLAKNATYMSQGIRNAISTGMQNALYGASQNPDHPVMGALKGFGIGAATGGVLGYAGGVVKRDASIINDVRNSAAASGADQGSINTQNTVRTQLNNGGKELAKKQVLAQQQQAVEDELQPMTKEQMTAKTTTAYQPLNDSKGTIDLTGNDPQAQTPTAAAKVQSLIAAKPKLPLDTPLTELPQNASIQDLMTYNKELKPIISSMYKNPSLTPYVSIYKNLQNSVESDIKTLSYQQGLGDQYEVANKTAYDMSIQGQVQKVYDMSKNAASGLLNEPVFDRRVTKLLNDPKVQANPKMLNVIQGIKTIVSHGKELTTGNTAPQVSSSFLNPTHYIGLLIRSDAGIKALQLLGSMSPTAATTRAISQALISGAMTHLIAKPSQPAQDNQMPSGPVGTIGIRG